MNEGITEARPNDFDGVDDAFDELFHHEFGDDLDVGKRGSIIRGKVSEQIAVCPGNELRTLAADDGVLRRRFDIGDNFQDVGIQRATESLV